MGLYGTNHQQLHQKIRAHGNQSVSKSIDAASKRLGGLVKTSMSNKNNSILMKDMSVVNEIGLNQRISNTRMSKVSATKQLSMKTMPNNMPASNNNSRHRIDQSTFNDLNEPPKIDRVVPIREKKPIKPFMPKP